MNNILFSDAALQRAAAALREARLTAQSPPTDFVHEFSPCFEQAMERLTRKGRRRTVRRNVVTIAASLLLILVIGACTTLAVSPEARATVATWLSEPQRDVLLVTEPSFTLNGEDYPLGPVLQDFIDRGWKRGNWIEQIGSYSEEGGPTDIVPTGYKLTSGDNRVNAYLDVEACRKGVQPNECGLRSMRFTGEGVDSFCLDGIELSNVDRSHIVELLGDPDEIEEKDLGVIYHYSMSEKGISEITFAFPSGVDTVTQIFIVFE